jgi:hypothetical protein
MDARSYDDRQLAAVLVKCATCPKSFYMTSRRRRCFECEDFYRQPSAPRVVDVSGNPIWADS